MRETGHYLVASDVGGTFTDTVVVDDSGQVRRYKAPTTPGNLVDGVLATFDLAAAELEASREEFIAGIRLFSHGTTVATNGLLQRRGAKTGVLMTEGFGDTPKTMRGMKGFGLEDATFKNWRGLRKQYSIVEQPNVREIGERVDYAGRVVRPLDEEGARAAIRELLDRGVEAIAICLLWCTQHPEHERRLVEIVSEEAPELYVSASSDVLPRIGEYSRMITTAVNAFLGPEVAGVTSSLDSTLRDAGLQHRPLLMQSNGGLAAVAEAARSPVSFLLSGPVGGVVGSRLVAAELDEPNVVTADMGGTSFDVGLVVDGRPLLAPVTFMDNQPISVPSVAVQTIGAGGGSIARVEDGDAAGRTRAAPAPFRGPPATASGGTEPTVTDADVVLGLVNPDTFLGGRKPLDREAAAAAIRERVAEPLELSVEEAAMGIKRIVDARMADLCRQATIHKGHDPRNFILVAFGGAGPVHAHAFGAGLGVKKIVVPTTASVHSAMGIAASDLVVTHEVTHAFRTPPGSTVRLRADRSGRGQRGDRRGRGGRPPALRRPGPRRRRRRAHLLRRHPLPLPDQRADDRAARAPAHRGRPRRAGRAVRRDLRTALRRGLGLHRRRHRVRQLARRRHQPDRERRARGRCRRPAASPQPLRHDDVYFDSWTTRRSTTSRRWSRASS